MRSSRLLPLLAGMFLLCGCSAQKAVTAPVRRQTAAVRLGSTLRESPLLCVGLYGEDAARAPVWYESPGTLLNMRTALTGYAEGWAASVRDFPPEQRVLLGMARLRAVCAYAPDAPHCHDAYGALILHGAVCDGIASAFSLLMQAAKIPCIVIRGETTADGIPHAWNLVQLNGAWYHADCLFDSAPAHAYFLRGDAALCGERIWDVSEYPAAPSDGTAYADILRAMRGSVKSRSSAYDKAAGITGTQSMQEAY